MKKTLLTAALLVASATAFGQQPAARTGYAGATLGESRFWGACDTPVALGFTCDMMNGALVLLTWPSSVFSPTMTKTCPKDGTAAAEA